MMFRVACGLCSDVTEAVVQKPNIAKHVERMHRTTPAAATPMELASTDLNLSFTPDLLNEATSQLLAQTLLMQSGFGLVQPYMPLAFPTLLDMTSPFDGLSFGQSMWQGLQHGADLSLGVSTPLVLPSPGSWVPAPLPKPDLNSAITDGSGNKSSVATPAAVPAETKRRSIAVVGAITEPPPPKRQRAEITEESKSSAAPAAVPPSNVSLLQQPRCARLLLVAG
jgi:hypothetical protein